MNLFAFTPCGRKSYGLPFIHEAQHSTAPHTREASMSTNTHNPRVFFDTMLDALAFMRQLQSEAEAHPRIDCVHTSCTPDVNGTYRVTWKTVRSR